MPRTTDKKERDWRYPATEKAEIMKLQRRISPCALPSPIRGRKGLVRSRTFRLLLIVAGGLMLMAAIAPSAKATLIAYYNFEGAADPPYPVDMTSNAPGVVITQLITDYPPGDLSAPAGIALNVAVGDLEPNLTGLGLSRSGAAGARNFDTGLNSGVGIYDVTSVSFALNAAGNGFTSARVGYSFDGGTTFTYTAAQVVPSSGAAVYTFNIPAGTTLNQPLLIIRIQLSGGQSNGGNLQNTLDNIQINGTIVPEPATVAGGLLGVLGLGWQQRRRLKLLLPRLRRT